MKSTDALSNERIAWMQSALKITLRGVLAVPVIVFLPSVWGSEKRSAALEPLPVGETGVARRKTSLWHRGIIGGDPLAGRRPFMPRKAEEFSCGARGRSP